MECHVLSCRTSKGPRSISICTWNLPLKPDGTRHEYRPRLTQPNWNLSVTNTFPFSSTILNVRSGARLQLR